MASTTQKAQYSSTHAVLLLRQFSTCGKGEKSANRGQQGLVGAERAAEKNPPYHTCRKWNTLSVHVSVQADAEAWERMGTDAQFLKQDPLQHRQPRTCGNLQQQLSAYSTHSTNRPKSYVVHTHCTSHKGTSRAPDESDR